MCLSTCYARSGPCRLWLRRCLPHVRLTVMPITVLPLTFVLGQSKNKASIAIKAILALDDSIKAENAAILRLYASAGSPLVNVVDLNETLQRARTHLQRLEQTRSQHFKSLAVDDTAVLRDMKQNKYLIARMNALALKQRLRDRLRQRKFEMERLERNYRRTMNGTSPAPT